MSELDDAVKLNDFGKLREELGDLLFAVVNLSRHLGVDPEDALGQANTKFKRRFAHIEAKLTEQGRNVAEADLAEMEMLWAMAVHGSDVLRSRLSSTGDTALTRY